MFKGDIELSAAKTKSENKKNYIVSSNHIDKIEKKYGLSNSLNKSSQEDLKEKNLVKEKVRNIDIYLGSIGQKGFLKAQKLGYELRKAGICAEYDTVKRSVKAQLKYADKIKAKYCVVIGDSEIDEDKIQIKFMEKSEQLNVKLSNIKDEILKLLKEKV